MLAAGDFFGVLALSAAAAAFVEPDDFGVLGDFLPPALGEATFLTPLGEDFLPAGEAATEAAAAAAAVAVLIVGGVAFASASAPPGVFATAGGGVVHASRWDTASIAAVRDGPVEAAAGASDAGDAEGGDRDAVAAATGALAADTGSEAGAA